MLSIKLYITLLFLLLMTCPIKGAELAPRCSHLKDSTMTRICAGRYPVDIGIKYMDALVPNNEKYTIYSIDNEENQFFITFKSSPLADCAKFRIVDSDNYVCLDQGEKPLQVKPGPLACLEVNFEMVDELVAICTGKPMESSIFSVLHYANTDIYRPIVRDIPHDKRDGASGIQRNGFMLLLIIFWIFIV